MHIGADYDFETATDEVFLSSFRPTTVPFAMATWLSVRLCVTLMYCSSQTTEVRLHERWLTVTFRQLSC